jgi:hypothetical protein
MAAENKNQKITLTSNEGTNIEVGMAIILPPPNRLSLIMSQIAWSQSGPC